jgi:hypothetical protein
MCRKRGTVIMKNFINICKMTQNHLKKYVSKELEKTHKGLITSGDGYVYAQGEFPVLLVAHMDTVHKSLPRVINYVEATETISSPNGIGGDDRCGVYMVLEVIKKFNCSVLFTEDEEKGCIGAGKFIDSDIAKKLSFNYIIEFDRKGNNDAVFYDCDNADFTEFITKEFFKEAWGSFSDISTLAPYLECAAVNLSCGYYKPHTTSEYVVFPEMKKVIEEACKILERTTEEDEFEYIERKRYSDYYYDNYYDYYLIEYRDEECEARYYYTTAQSRAEAIGKFVIENPHLTYNDVTDIVRYNEYF